MCIRDSSEAVWSRHPEAAEEAPGPLGSVLRLADWTSCLILTEDPDVAARAVDEATLAAAHLGLTIDELQRTVALASPEFAEMADSFEVESVNPDSFDEIVRSAQAGLARMTLDIVSQIGEEQLRNDELVETNQELAAAASTDALTGLPNRRTFDAFLGNQVAARMRHPRDIALGLIVMDLDKFKSVNDTYGHQIGDIVLKSIAENVKGVLREGDTLMRYGGEEFLAVLPGAGEADLRTVGERMRRIVESSVISESNTEVRVTISLGGVSFPSSDVTDLDDLIRKADAAMYTAKKTGRNRLTLVDA